MELISAGTGRDEVAVRLVGQYAGDGGLARSGRAVQQQAGRRLDAQVAGQGRVFQQQLHLAQFALGAGGQDDIVPGQAGTGRAGLGLADLRLAAGGLVQRFGAFLVGGLAGLQGGGLGGGFGGGFGLAQVAQGQGERVVRARVVGGQVDGAVGTGRRTGGTLRDTARSSRSA